MDRRAWQTQVMDHKELDAINPFTNELFNPLMY